jgi:hypothetical protein
MANPSRKRQLTTKDDVPLSDLLDYGQEIIRLYNEAPKGFLARLTQEVSSRTFMQRTGDMTWQELAEMEHARTGTLSSEQMAFSVKSYGRDLGYSREFIEDNPADILRDEFAELVKGAETKNFEILFDVMKNGIADGSELWYTPQDYGAYSFSDTHDHTFADTQELFEADGDTDTNAHTVGEHVREANAELRHHGKNPDVVFCSNDVANALVGEYRDANLSVPELAELRENDVNSLGLKVDGANIVQTAWLSGMDVYHFASGEKPIKTHTVRPVELTDSTGAPVGGAGGSRGDPAALLGAYGSMRMGAKMVDPLAGVKYTIDNLS